MTKIKFSIGDGSFIEISLKDGVVHSEDSGAIILRTKEGVVLNLHFRDGKLHRENGPALEAEKFGVARIPMFFLNGTLQPMPQQKNHRKFNP